MAKNKKQLTRRQIYALFGYREHQFTALNLKPDSIHPVTGAHLYDRKKVKAAMLETHNHGRKPN